MKEHDFGFTGSEEPTWAGMDTMAEDEVLTCRRDKLMLVFVAGLLAFVAKPVPIISGSIRVDSVIFQYFHRNEHIGAFGDHSSIGEHNLLKGEAVHGGCCGVSTSHSFKKENKKVGWMNKKKRMNIKRALKERR